MLQAVSILKKILAYHILYRLCSAKTNYYSAFHNRSKGYLEYKLCRYLLHNKDSRQTSAMPISALDIQDKLPKHENSPTPSILDNRSESTTNVSIKSWPLIRDEFRMMHSRATSVPNMSLEMERAKSAGPAFSKGNIFGVLILRKSFISVKL